MPRLDWLLPTVTLTCCLMSAHAQEWQEAHLSLSLLSLDAAASQPTDYQGRDLGQAGEDATTPSSASHPGITGDWFGARRKLEHAGLYVAGYLQLDVTKVLRGGLDTGSWPIHSLVDLNLLADMSKLHLPGGTFFFDFQWHEQSSNADTAVGDSQGYDNLESVRYVQVAQLWYKQSFGNLRLKVGKIDANTDAAVADTPANDGFSLMEHSTQFLHSAAVYSPTIFPMVTYPDPAPGLSLFYSADEQTGPYLGLATFYSNTNNTFLDIAGHPNDIERTNGDMFSIGEVGTRWAFGELPGHAGAGGWFHNGTFPEVGNPSTRSSGAGGGYAFIDQTLIHEAPRSGPTRDLGVFGNVGLASSRTSPMDQGVCGGVCATGFIPGRPDDVVGVLGSWVHLSQKGLPHNFEFATELFYKLQITQWASLKPSFEYIVDPSGLHPDAAVITLRAEIDF